MQTLQKSIKIRRMDECTNNLCIGVIFLLVGGVFVAAAVWLLMDGNMEGILTLLISLPCLAIALCWVLPYFQHIVLTETTVQVFLGPLKLQEMPAEDIHTLLFSTVTISLRGSKEQRDMTKVPVLVLSTRSSAYLKMMYRRFAEKECGQRFESEQEKEEFILHYAIDTHIGSSGRNLRMRKEEGVWMEYTPERFRILRQLFPQVEDCT